MLQVGVQLPQVEARHALVLLHPQDALHHGGHGCTALQVTDVASEGVESSSRVLSLFFVCSSFLCVLFFWLDKNTPPPPKKKTHGKQHEKYTWASKPYMPPVA